MDLRELKGGEKEGIFWHKAKSRLVEILLNKIKKKSAKILDVGCGVGGIKKVISQYGEVWVNDIDEESLNLINIPDERKILSDFNEIKGKKEFFDIITMFDVLEHIKEDRKSVEKAYEMLKPNGSLLITVPAFQVLYGGFDRYLHHHRRYDKRKLMKLINGFRIKYNSYWNFFLFLPFFVMRIIQKKKKIVKKHPHIGGILNNIFYWLLSLENKMINKGLVFPFGMSLVLVLEKKVK